MSWRLTVGLFDEEGERPQATQEVQIDEAGQWHLVEGEPSKRQPFMSTDARMFLMDVATVFLMVLLCLTVLMLGMLVQQEFELLRPPG